VGEGLHHGGDHAASSVTERTAFGRITEQPPQDLSERVSAGRRPRGSAWAERSAGDVLADLILHLGAALQVTRQGDVGNDRLTGEQDRGFHVGGRQAVPGHVDVVVDPPDDPQVAVLVPDCGVADQAGLGAEARPVRLDVARVVVVEGSQHRGSWPLEHEQSLALLDALSRGVVQHVGEDTRERMGGRAGPGVGERRERGDHDLLGFGRPPCIDNRAALPSDDHVEPEPCLRVDRPATVPTSRSEPRSRRLACSAPFHAFRWRWSTDATCQSPLARELARRPRRERGHRRR